MISRIMIERKTDLERERERERKHFLSLPLSFPSLLHIRARDRTDRASKERQLLLGQISFNNNNNQREPNERKKNLISILF